LNVSGNGKLREDFHDERGKTIGGRRKKYRNKSRGFFLRRMPLREDIRR